MFLFRMQLQTKRTKKMIENSKKNDETNGKNEFKSTNKLIYFLSVFFHFPLIIHSMFIGKKNFSSLYKLSHHWYRQRFQKQTNFKEENFQKKQKISKKNKQKLYHLIIHSFKSHLVTFFQLLFLQCSPYSK